MDRGYAMGRGQRKIWVVVAAAMIWTSVSMGAQPAASAPYVTVNPASGPPGQTVSLSGSGFGGGTCGIYLLPNASPSPDTKMTPDAGCTVDPNGGLSELFQVPSASPGGYNIWVCTKFSKSLQCASTGFKVDPPPITTTTTAPSTTTTAATTTTTAPTTTTAVTTTTAPTTTTSVTPTTTTTSTTTPIAPTPPADFDPTVLDGPLPPRFGLGAGQFGTSTQLRVPGVDESKIPPSVTWRCAVPPDATIRDFDAPSTTDETGLLFPVGDTGTVFRPAVGTISSPNAVLIDTSGRRGYRERQTLGSDGPGYVGMYVGLPEPTDASITIRVNAYDLHATIIDIDEITLEPGAHPATNCLLVNAGTRSSIESIQILAFGTDQPIMIDRVFSGDVYPIERDPIPLDVNITYPRDGARINTARATPIIGSITSKLPFFSGQVQVLVYQCEHCGVMVLEAEKFTSVPIGNGEFRTMFILDGLHVRPGEHRITATVTDWLASGSDSINVTGSGDLFLTDDAYRGDIADSVDVVPWSMEVTQAVRGPLEVQAAGSTVVDDFPLVTNKRTVVRGYAVQQFPDGPRITPQDLAVPGLLYGTRDGASLPGSPLVPEFTLPKISTLTPGPEAEADARPALHRTHDFLLPESWTNGEVTLTYEVNPPGWRSSARETPGHDGPLNMISRTVNFTDVGTFGVSPILVEYFWRCDADMLEQWYSPCSADGVSVGDQVSNIATVERVRQSILNWWKTIPAPGDYPTRFGFPSTIQIKEPNASPAIELPHPDVTGPASGVGYSTLNDAFRSLDCKRHLRLTKISMPDMRTFSMFVTPPGAPGLSGGCAWRGGHKVFRTSVPWWIMAQEAGHTAGMTHSSRAHGETAGGSGLVRWPGDHGELDQQTTWGFDTTTMTPVVAADGSHVHDYMSYGPTPRWTAVDTWEHMFEAFRRNRSIGEDRGRSASGGTLDDGPVGTPVPIRVISGFVAADGTVYFDAPVVGTGGPNPTGDGPLLALADSSGEVVFETSVTVLGGATHGSDDAGYWFEAEIPAAIHGTTLSLFDAPGGNLLGTREANTATIDGPPTGDLAISVTPGAEGPTVSWDVQDGLDYRVSLSLDGQGWFPVADSSGEPVEVRGADLGLAGSGWSLRVEGTDGINVAYGSVEDVDLGLVAPIAAIATPSDGALLTPGVFDASAMGVVLNNDMTYTWVIDGEPLAGGQSAKIPLVETGSHSIQLVVENEVGSDSMLIEVNVGADDDLDGLPDDWELTNGLDPTVADDALSDTDLDGLNALAEFRIGTSPSAIDTDGDDFSDSVEFDVGTDPLDPSERPGFVHGPTVVLAARVSAGSATGTGDGASSTWPITVAMVAASLVLGAVAWFVRRRTVSPS